MRRMEFLPRGGADGAGVDQAADEGRGEGNEKGDVRGQVEGVPDARERDEQEDGDDGSHHPEAQPSLFEEPGQTGTADLALKRTIEGGRLGGHGANLACDFWRRVDENV